MTFKGIVCDQSKRQEREYLSKEECFSCVQSSTRPCPFNGKIMRLMWQDGSDVPALTFSPTRVHGCPRAMWFMRHNPKERLLNPYTRWHSLRGTLSHSFFEGQPVAPGVQRDIAEERLETIIHTKYGPVSFVGKPDLFEVIADEGHTIKIKITDWKSISEIKHSMLEAKEDHQKQINSYAFLAREALPRHLNRPGLRVEVTELEIVYFNMSKVRRFTSASQISDRGKLLAPRSAGNYEPLTLEPIELKPHEEMKLFITEWIEAAIDARETPAAPLTGDAAALCSYCPFQKECIKMWKEENR